MRLLDRNKVPSGGWHYYQKETEWKRAAHDGQTLVRQMVEHRLANKLPRATPDECWLDLEEFTCERLRGKATLWANCECRFPMPAPLHHVSAVVHFPQITVDYVQPKGPGNAAKPCKTCGGG